MFTILSLHSAVSSTLQLLFIYSKFTNCSYKLLFCFLLTVIGQRLAAMNLLSPLAISDEFSTVRLQHNRAFTELLHAASSSLYPQVPGHVTSMSTRAGVRNLFYFKAPPIHTCNGTGPIKKRSQIILANLLYWRLSSSRYVVSLGLVLLCKVGICTMYNILVNKSIDQSS